MGSAAAPAGWRPCRSWRSAAPRRSGTTEIMSLCLQQRRGGKDRRGFDDVGRLPPGWRAAGPARRAGASGCPSGCRIQVWATRSASADFGQVEQRVAGPRHHAHRLALRAARSPDPRRRTGREGGRAPRRGRRAAGAGISRSLVSTCSETRTRGLAALKRARPWVSSIGVGAHDAADAHQPRGAGAPARPSHRRRIRNRAARRARSGSSPRHRPWAPCRARGARTASRPAPSSSCCSSAVAAGWVVWMAAAARRRLRCSSRALSSMICRLLMRSAPEQARRGGHGDAAVASS